MSNFLKIDIGSLICRLVAEKGLETLRICSFFSCKEEDIIKMYNAQSLDTELLLKWSKILEYDFFRIYTQHLILYAPQSSQSDAKKTTSLPAFRKNVYTKEIIEFILEEIACGKITKKEPSISTEYQKQHFINGSKNTKYKM